MTVFNETVLVRELNIPGRSPFNAACLACVLAVKREISLGAVETLKAPHHFYPRRLISPVFHSSYTSGENFRVKGDTLPPPRRLNFRSRDAKDR
jgi:hypothetical protein